MPSGSGISTRLFVVSAIVFATVAFFVLPARADASSLVWGDQSGGTPAQVEMSEGGTYTPLLGVSAPAYLNTSINSGLGPFGKLYRITGTGDTPTRELLATVSLHNGPDSAVSDTEFSWPATGAYELEVYSSPPLPPPPNQTIERDILRFIARVFLADIAYAAAGPPPRPVLRETVHFTIQEAPTTFTPVIIIPGILGSAQHNGQWLIDPITHAYDNLIDTLAANGYEKDKTLFPFPYDWHKSNIDTAVLLKQRIDEIKTICNCSKVDIVAHSMGGLVARQYIQSGYYGHDVRKLIFLGTPQLGAPKAYLMWEGGEEDTEFLDQILKNLLFIEAKKHGYSNLFGYLHAAPIPSVQELLPIYGYIKHAGSPDIPSYPNTSWYPSNAFLENLNSGVGALYNSGVTISNFIGDLASSTTISTIRVTPPPNASSTILWGYGIPENFGNSSTDQGLERDAGDGTVPLSSADLIINDLQVLNSEHNELPTKAESAVFKKLTNKDAETLVNNGHGFFETAKNVLIFQILSPADIVVVGPDGKRVGKDFSSGQEINEVPGAFYSGFGTDDEFITIPDPSNGEYKILTQGTGSGGEYTIATGVIGDATSSEMFFTGETWPNLVTEHDVNVDPANPGKTTITPADQIPPTITFIQPATTIYTHDALLPIKVTFTDDTGIASSSVSFDTTPTAASSTIDLFFQTLGNHTVAAYAEDLVNNATASAKKIQVTATISSTQNDVNRAYTLKWIKSKDLKNALTSTLTVSSKLKKQRDKIALYKEILEGLKFAKKKGVITQQVYDLLTADINWLINH